MFPSLSENRFSGNSFLPFPFAAKLLHNGSLRKKIRMGHLVVSPLALHDLKSLSV